MGIWIKGCLLHSYFIIGENMALFSNLRTASSGLTVSGTAMNVIGDNIANVNTVGFKRGRASFADSFLKAKEIRRPMACEQACAQLEKCPIGS